MGSWRARIAAWLASCDPEEGQGLVEYGLVIVLIAIACFTALMGVGGAINEQLYSQIVGTLLPVLGGGSGG